MPRLGSLPLLLVCSWVALGSPGSLSAQAGQQPDTLRQRSRLPAPTAEQVAGIVVHPNPAFSPGAPSAQTGPFLLVYAGVAYTPRTRYIKGKHDGTGLVGAAFGDPVRWLGVQADLGVYSKADEGNSVDRAGLSLEVYRYLPGDLVLSVGWENLATRGDPDTGESQYAVLSRWFRLREPDAWLSSVGVSVGVGNGRYVRERDWVANDTNALNVFGSAAVQVAWPVALIADWQGDDLTLGAAFTPLRRHSLVLTSAVYDVTGTVDSSTGFMASLLYAYRVW